MAFISLGLPDALLGSAWPVMYGDLGVPLSFAGLLAIAISAGTITSSLLSDRLTRRFGPGLVTAASVVVSALAIFGFGAVNTYWQLLLLAIPAGLSAGAIDAALNNYVAANYSSKHMNWLHSFWGVGTIIGPFLMAAAIAAPLGWQGGYRWAALVQAVIALVLIATLPLWRRVTTHRHDSAKTKSVRPALKLREVIALPGVLPAILALFGYVALEGTAILWAATYLTVGRGVPAEQAARFASFFLIGVTVGRFLAGFIAGRLGDRNMVRLGLAIGCVGTVAISLPLGVTNIALAGLIVIGLGCAPIFPAWIHATPAVFGTDKSQAIIGVQMAGAYFGAIAMPPLFGVIANNISIRLFPAFLAIMLLFTLAMVRMTPTGMSSQPGGAAV